MRSAEELLVEAKEGGFDAPEGGPEQDDDCKLEPEEAGDTLDEIGGRFGDLAIDEVEEKIYVGNDRSVESTVAQMSANEENICIREDECEWSTTQEMVEALTSW